MPETRRDLFRASILSALGIVSAGAVAGCGKKPDFTGGPIFGSRLSSGLVGATVAVYAQSSGPWYFFQFGGSYPLACTAYYPTSNISFPQIGPTPSNGPSPTNIVDTASWFSSLGSVLQPVASANNKIIAYNNMLGNPGSISLTTDGSGNLQSLDSLLKALADLNQIPGSWNEIGKNHNV